jgi:hypothetical protein
MIGFGPWIEGLTADERRARWRCLATLATVFLGPGHPLTLSLRTAEVEPDASRRALAELDALAPRIRRRLLAIYGAIHDGPGGALRAHT